MSPRPRSSLRPAGGHPARGRTAARSLARASVVTGATALLLGAGAAAPSVALASVASASVASASLASASKRDDGDQPDTTMSLGEALLILGVVPLLLFLLIAALVYAPSIARGPRYRPGLGWFASPVWFNGPEHPEAAVSAVETTRAAGGASARW